MPKEKREPEIFKIKPNLKTFLTKPLKKQNLSATVRVPAPVEKMESLDLRLPEQAAGIPADEITAAMTNGDVIYIYDLKVTDYSHLYLKNTFDNLFLPNHTPSFKENREAGTELSETAAIDAHNVLKKGLYHFNKGHYTDALAQFRLLLEKNPEDVNALFYSGSCLYLTGKPLQAIEKMEAVLQTSNNAFQQEAKWKLALSHLKTGNQQASKQLFTNIAAEKGIYSKQAEERLKGL